MLIKTHSLKKISIDFCLMGETITKLSLHLQMETHTNGEEGVTVELNDDCLNGIFEHLSIDDLVAANQCSRRFNEIAVEVIGRKMARKEVRVSRTPSLILNKFGDKITNICLEDLDIHMLEEIHRLCANLTRLIVSSDIEPPNINLFKSPILGEICAKLSELELYTICSDEESFPYIEQALSHCQKLKKLSLHWTYPYFLSTQFPSLRELYTIFDVESAAPQGDMLQQFFQNNRELENVSLVAEDIDISAVLALDCLVYLDISVQMQNEEMQNLLIGLSGISTLRHFGICTRMSHLLPFDRLKQLTSLKITNRDESYDVMDKIGFFMILDMPNLTEFCYSTNAEPRIDLCDIAFVVEKCPSLKTLWITRFMEIISSVMYVNELNQQFRAACEREHITLNIKPINILKNQLKTGGNILNAVRSAYNSCKRIVPNN